MAGSPIAVVGIDVVASVDSTQRELSKLPDHLTKAVQEMQSVLDGAKSTFSNFTVGLVSGMAGVLSVSAIKDFVSANVEAADQLNRLSQQAGVSVETLSAWGNVAKRNGVDVDDFAEQLNELSMKLLETKDSTSGAGAALKAIGLDYRDLAQKTPEEAFKAVAKAMSEVEDSGKKTAAAMAIGGDEYQKLIPILNEIGRAQSLEATITTAQAEAAAHYKDSLAELQVAGEAWSQAIVAGIIPALDDLVGATVDVLKGNGGLTDSARALAQDGSIDAWARNGVAAFTHVLDGGEQVMRVFRHLGTLIGADLAMASQAFSTMRDAASRAIEGEWAAALSTVKSGMAGVGAISKQADADLGQIWADDTLGAKIRSRLGEVHSVRNGVSGLLENMKKLDGLNLGGNDKGKQGKSATDHALQEYERLITKIRTKTAVEQAEIESGEKLTQGQKMAMEVMTQLRDGRLKLNDAQKVSVAQHLEEMLLAEKAVLDNKKAADWAAQASEENAAAVESRREAVDALRQQIEAQELANRQIGMSQEQVYEFTRLQREDAAAALERRAAILGEGDLADTLLAQAQAMRELNEAERKGVELAKEYRSSTSGGVSDGLKRYIDESSDLRTRVADLAYDATKSAEDVLMASLTRQKADVGSMITAIINEYMRLQAIKPLVASIADGSAWSSLMGLFGGSKGGSAGGGAGAGTIGVDTIPAGNVAAHGAWFDANFAAFAKGGSFTNRIVNSPTTFRFAQGGAMRNGLMGEAGPEAIMPLVRTGSGHLGVRAVGGQAQQLPPINQYFSVGEMMTRGQMMEIAQTAAMGVVSGHAAALAAAGRREY